MSASQEQLTCKAHIASATHPDSRPQAPDPRCSLGSAAICGADNGPSGGLLGAWHGEQPVEGERRSSPACRMYARGSPETAEGPLGGCSRSPEKDTPTRHAAGLLLTHALLGGLALVTGSRREGCSPTGLFSLTFLPADLWEPRESLEQREFLKMQF